MAAGQSSTDNTDDDPPAGDIPDISVTSPGSTDRRPTGFERIIKGDDARGRKSREAAAVGVGGGGKDDSRPSTPSRKTSRSREGRPDSSSSRWASPARLIRSRSSNYVTPTGTPRRTENGNGGENGGEQQAPSSPMDPLSQHILNRTSLNPPTSSHNQRPSTSEGVSRDRGSSAENGRAPAVQSPPRRSVEASSEAGATAQKDLRKGVKAVSFITRLMGTKKKDDESGSKTSNGNLEEESVSNEDRPEGNDAELFTEPVGSVGFNPRLSRPPAYIKVRSKYKKQRDFDHLFLAQELECTEKRKTPARTSSSSKLRRKSSTGANVEADTVWAMQFSRDGRYLAAAGVDCIVRVWAVLASFEDRLTHEKQELGDSDPSGPDAYYEHLSSPVFQSHPVREYEGHSATVLDLSWSKNNFLLSSSMDKTVRLWHVSRAECLCTFKHGDYVPSISFHPKDDRFFLAGSLDSKLRLWSIPDKSVAFTAVVPDMITAVAFTPDGKSAMAGCHTGLCMFYETDGLKYQSQIHARSTRGHNAKGSKVTGMQAFYDSTGEAKLLATSNDSRIRLYNFRDKNLEMKFRGNENNCSQIRASVSDDGRYVICGSEDCKAYIWSLGLEDGERRDKRPVELFEAHDFVVSSACFAPAKTRAHLARSQDAVYDLCNPPAMSYTSHGTDQSSLHHQNQQQQSASRASSKPTTESGGSIQSTPKEAEGMTTPILDKDKIKSSSASITTNGAGQHLTKTNHPNGNILVTADLTGKIKVFRQDCAWSKRRSGNGAGDDGDRASIFSKRGNNNTTSNSGKVSRQGSTATMASTRSQRSHVLGFQSQASRNSAPAPSGIGGGVSNGSGGGGPSSDRIISWRQGIVTSPSINSESNVAASSAGGSAAPAKMITSAVRSASPGKIGEASQSSATTPTIGRSGSGSGSTARGSGGISINNHKTSSYNASRKSLPHLDTITSNDGVVGEGREGGRLADSPTSIRSDTHNNLPRNPKQASEQANQQQNHSNTIHTSKPSAHNNYNTAVNSSAKINTNLHRSSSSASSPKNPSSPTDNNPLLMQEGGRSYFFYNTDEWRARASRMRSAAHSHADGLSSVLTREEEEGERHGGGGVGFGDDGVHLSVNGGRPGLGSRGLSVVSRLSDERSEGTEEVSPGGDAEEGGVDDGEEFADALEG